MWLTASVIHVHHGNFRFIFEAFNSLDHRQLRSLNQGIGSLVREVLHAGHQLLGLGPGDVRHGGEAG